MAREEPPRIKPVLPKIPRNEDGYKFRAGSVPLSEDGKLVLLVSSTGHPGRWILPAGTLEQDEDPRSGAVRETSEEAGVRGSVICRLGEVDYQVKRNKTQFYVLAVEKEQTTFVEQTFRTRAWFDIDHATRVLAWHPESRLVFDEFLSNYKEITELARQMAIEKQYSQILQRRQSDIGKRRFFVNNIRKVDNLASLASIFGRETLVNWLCLTKIDPMEPLAGYEEVVKRLATGDLAQNASNQSPSRSALSDERQWNFSRWATVVDRISECKELAAKDRASKCYKRFLKDIWTGQKPTKLDE